MSSEVLGELAVRRAREVLPLFDGQRLRLVRETLELTQRGLADLVEGRVTAAALSQFENGDAKPSASTLADLADATAFPVGFFARDPAVGGVARVDGFFRSLRSTSSRQRRRHRAQAELVRLVAVGLERLVRFPVHEVPRLPVSPDASRTEVEAVAQQVRAAWELPHGPVNDVIRTAERHGIVVVRLLLGSATVDAFSVPFPDRPVIVLGDDKGEADRSRWDCIHELGHLVMHDPDPQRSRYLEDQANWFAGEFLLPATEVVDELPSTADWDALADLKVRWGVSITALLQRAKSLGVMPDGTYVQALKTMSTRGWNRREPVRLSRHESPALLARGLDLAATEGHTLDEIAEELRLPSALVREIVGASVDPRPQLNL